MRLSRPVLAVPAAVVLLWGLTACGSSTPAAESTSSAAPSVTAEETPEPTADALTAANFLQTVTEAQKAIGNYEFAMTMTSEGQTLQATGAAHLEGDAPSVAMIMQMPEMSMEMRVVGGLTYMSLGELTGGKFLQIDPNDASNPMAGAAGDMMEGIDPSQGLAGQEAAIVSLTKTGGPEQLDGVEVDVYELVVDPSKMPEELAELQASLPEGTEMPKTFTYVYWVDAQNLVRKVKFDTLGSAGEMTFTKHGAAAAVVAPTAEEIATEGMFG